MVSVETEALKTHVQDRYKVWGVPDTCLRNGLTTEVDFAAILSAAEGRMPTMPCRIFPSSFDPNDAYIHAFPRSLEWNWQTLEQALDRMKARIVMTRIPHFWQLESPIHAVCRRAKAPIFTNEPENMLVGAAAIASAGVDAIVHDALFAPAFTSYLQEWNITIPQKWVLIHNMYSPEWTVPSPLEDSPVQIAQEVHISPGVPVLYQCEILSRDKASRFHVSEDFFAEIEGQDVFLTSAGNDPLPVYRLKLSIPFRVIGSCTCGMDIVERSS